jgi:Ca2+-binding RTX toxin-like protein
VGVVNRREGFLDRCRPDHLVLAAQYRHDHGLCARRPDLGRHRGRRPARRGLVPVRHEPGHAAHRGAGCGHAAARRPDQRPSLIFDGDDENDNVVNTNTYYPRVDVEAWGIAILNKLFAGTTNNDTLNGTVVGDTIHGQGGNDTLSGRGGADTLFGDAGNDVLDGGADADTMAGGAGNDTYVVDNGGDQVIESANEGNDTVYASIHYRLTANVDNLVLQGGTDLQGYGNSEINVLTGNAGNDLLDGGAGADTMLGAAGHDAYFVDNGGDQVIENPNAGNDTVYAWVHYRLAANVDNLILHGGGDLQAYGNSLVNALYGNSANNILNGEAGADTMVAGLGNDAYFVDNIGDTVIENANQGSDTVYASVDYRLSASVEYLVLQGSAVQGYGNDLTNVIYGTDGDNLLDGNIGADTMFGGAGNDAYFVDNAGDFVVENANQGNDTVYASVDYMMTADVDNLVLQEGVAIQGYGNGLANALFGNANGNLLNGGGGADFLTGGGGNDVFVFAAGEAGGDMVADFAGNGGGAGDWLLFVGYGSGATFTNIDTTHWQVNYNNGVSHEVIVLMNGAAIDVTDVAFM